MVAAGAVTWLVLAGGPLSLAAQPAPAATKVGMKAFAFMPAKVTIKAGDTVTWTYDETPSDLGCESPVFQLPGSPVTCPGHSATAVDKGADGKPLFDSGVHRANGFPYSFTFAKAGTYHYICVVHGGANKNNPITNMEGDIVVEPAAASAPAPAPASSEAPAQPMTTAAPTQVLGASTSAASAGQLANTGTRSALAWALLPLVAGLSLRRRRRS
jgi:plastocyanin